MFETSVSPTAPLNLDIEYQNADLWGLWGAANAPRAPPLVTGLACHGISTAAIYSLQETKHQVEFPPRTNHMPALDNT